MEGIKISSHNNNRDSTKRRIFTCQWQNLCILCTYKRTLSSKLEVKYKTERIRSTKRHLIRDKVRWKEYKSRVIKIIETVQNTESLHVIDNKETNRKHFEIRSETQNMMAGFTWNLQNNRNDKTSRDNI